MNKEQKKQIIALLKKDCRAEGEYLTEDNRTCAIGCLALAAGCSEAKLREAGGTKISFITSGIREAIEKKFGLSIENLTRLQTANDWTNSVTERRAACIEVIKEIS